MVLKENSSSMYLPAMLRFKRLSAVTAMMAMTIPMIAQRTWVGFWAGTANLFCSLNSLLSARFIPLTSLLNHSDTYGAPCASGEAAGNAPLFSAETFRRGRQF